VAEHRVENRGFGLIHVRIQSETLSIDDVGNHLVLVPQACIGVHFDYNQRGSHVSAEQVMVDYRRPFDGYQNEIRPYESGLKMPPT
jgi:hypothetical protein